MKKDFSFWGPVRCELMDVACSESSVIPLGYSCAPGFRILKEIFESGWFSDVCERDRDGQTARHIGPTDPSWSTNQHIINAPACHKTQSHIYISHRR